MIIPPTETIPEAPAEKPAPIEHKAPEKARAFERGNIVQSTPESGMDIRDEVWLTEERETGTHIKLRHGKWWKASDFRLAEEPAQPNRAVTDLRP